MKVVILAGGRGERLSEETIYRPKPLVEIGGMPIIWHIMKHYSSFGENEFVICCGYKGYLIKEFFANYFLHTSDVTLNLREGEMHIHGKKTEPWIVTILDTGLETMTGGRLKQAEKFLTDQDDFHFTYGDGLSDVNISELIKSHKDSNQIATVTAVQPPGRFGAVVIEKNNVIQFTEKPEGQSGLINGGYFVLNRKVFGYIDGNPQTIWEDKPLQSLAKEGQLNAYLHSGFWQPMDTLRDKNYLEKLWAGGNTPWVSNK